MKILMKLVCILLLGGIFGCSLFNSGLSEGGKLCYGLIKKSGKRIGQKYGLSPSGIGAGGVYGLRLMILDFNRYGEPLTQKEARKLIILCAEEFLKDINSDEKLTSYLMDFPFSERNIDVSIFSYDNKGRDIYEPYIGVVSLSRGNIRYVTYILDQLNENSQFKETYEEALEKLKQEEQTHNQNN
ncbi:hypothetical protein [Candidatus Protochlamydia phocaeensis]|uniref:hypothetical protein n=1 Tax=Candidatus Protochlamydia phocaeensis TaxID=1414722 RepID=UPI000837B962|nr:hypothetical protein [Candidatus Protochlamydia phocaeensis]